MGIPTDHSGNRFVKEERLKKKKSIDSLFSTGKKKSLYPVLVFALVNKEDKGSQHKVLFSIPKKHFKKAVVRNKIRRRLREAFRLNKSILYNTPSRFPFLIGYVYISKNVLSYNEINLKVIESLKYLDTLIRKENEVAEN